MRFNSCVFSVINEIHIENVKGLNTNLMIQISKKVNFGEFGLVRFRTPFDAIITRINSIDSEKTARSIKDEINRENIIDINNQELINLCDIIKREKTFDNNIDVFLAAWQLIHVRNNMGINYRKTLEYATKNYILPLPIFPNCFCTCRIFPHRPQTNHSLPRVECGHPVHKKR